MRRRPGVSVALLLALPFLGSLLTAGAAFGDRHHHHDYHRGWERDWDNRRDARRAGVVAGVVAGGVAGAVAEDRAEHRYRECVLATGYDRECDRRRYEDEYRARQKARRTGVVVGVATREAVRH